MQDLKLRGAWVHFPVGVTFWIFLFYCDSVESIESKANYIGRYVDQKGSAAMQTSIQLTGVTPEVDVRITQARKHAKGIHSGFETQGRRHQKSKTGVSEAPKSFKKKKEKKKKKNTEKLEWNQLTCAFR